MSSTLSSKQTNGNKSLFASKNVTVNPTFEMMSSTTPNSPLGKSSKLGNIGIPMNVQTGQTILSQVHANNPNYKNLPHNWKYQKGYIATHRNEDDSRLSGRGTAMKLPSLSSSMN